MKVLNEKEKDSILFIDEMIKNYEREIQRALNAIKTFRLQVNKLKQMKRQIMENHDK